MKKNKYGFLGFMSLLGFLGFYLDDPTHYSAFAFAVFFQYFFVTPDEMFVDNMKRMAAMAFFTNWAVTMIATLVLALGQHSSNALAEGIIYAWSASIMVFCFGTSFLEMRENYINREKKGKS